MAEELNNKEKWILTGYDLFGRIGPEALNVEKLSNIVGLNRSSFYHYFGDIAVFESHLLDYHISKYQMFHDIIKDYDKFEMLFEDDVMRHKEVLAFQRQLLINLSVPKYNECSLKARTYTEKKTYELWSAFNNVEKDSEEQWTLFRAIRDFYYIHYGQADGQTDKTDPKDVLVLLHSYFSQNK
ncbi:MAG: TetR/AcrR family transcriptional regulator [bacterium]|nr:TetR/AcrR family transcriptional regulator [bacterium]